MIKFLFIFYVIVIIIIVLSITLTVTKSEEEHVLENLKIATKKIQKQSFSLKTFERHTKLPVIAVFTTFHHAFGRIYTNIMNCLEGKYEFKCYEWSDSNRMEAFLQNYRYFDKIIGNTTISLTVKYIKMVNSDMKLTNKDILKKMYMSCHCPCINIERGPFRESVVFKEGNYSGVSLETTEMLEPLIYNKPYFTPCGVNIKEFLYTKKIKKINTIGFVGHPDSNKGVKKPQMFKEIAKLTNIKPVFIHGKDSNLNDELYKDIDLLICCSEFEGNPLPIFEAAACGVAVISTPVGNTMTLKNIKHFQNAKEASEIIINFNANPEKLQSYISDITREVREHWNWDFLVKKYWLDFLNN